MLACYTNAAQADATYKCGINQAQVIESDHPPKNKKRQFIREVVASFSKKK